INPLCGCGSSAADPPAPIDPPTIPTETVGPGVPEPRSPEEGANRPAATVASQSVVRLCPSRHIWLQQLRFGAQCTRPATFKGSSGRHRLKNSLNFDL